MSVKRKLSSLLPFLLPHRPFDYFLIAGGAAMSLLPFWNTSSPLPYPMACFAMGQAAIGAGFNSSVYGAVWLAVMSISMLF